ncbi:hypothetical protein [Bartonella sp. MM73XJBT.G]|uniref:hypothetical protein n=1 Tax=Bartonella sp. MM73XJBT.G TaxID=3019097 RepID=UPI0023630E70|nr:hypothetical protein [Bartonella sp. MM73XJBT.G]
MLNHSIDHDSTITPHQNSQADRTILYDEKSYKTSAIIIPDLSQCMIVVFQSV